ncbi:MAG: hypothetical protein U0V02_06040 [Anaerolineales bacterium]
MTLPLLVSRLAPPPSKSPLMTAPFPTCKAAPAMRTESVTDPLMTML